MKKIISILLLCLPLVLQAQTDAKYLAGGVTTEEGKVVFRTELQTSALSKTDLYQTARSWMEQRFTPDGKFNARVVYTDSLSGKIAAYGEEYLVFSSNALSLDRARVNYQLQLNIADQQCEMVISRIRYTYHEGEKNVEKYTAEEWITDEVALNKAQTKLMPICGKFRRKTIDLRDELSKSLQTAFGDHLLTQGTSAATPIRRNPSITTSVSVAQVAKELPLEQTEEAPVTRIPLSTENPTAVATTPHHLMVTAGDDEQFKLPQSAWGGESQLFGKHVTFCFIDTQKTAANLLLAENETYVLALYQEESATPYTTLRCKKLSMQTISGTEAVKMNAALDASKSYNMYVGEILE